MKIKLFAICAVIAFAVSCTHTSLDPNNPTNSDTTSTTTSSCDADTVYFTNSILPMMVSNCAMSGCHSAASAAEGVVLDNYQGILEEVKPGNPSKSKIYESVTGSGEEFMPPAPNTPLSTDQIALLKKWIEQGARNNTCSESCDTSNVTYNLSIQPIIATNCIGCHGTNSPSAGIDLSSYQKVKNIADIGQLTGAVNHEAGYAAMPPSGGKMSQCNLDKITIWINTNYPE